MVSMIASSMHGESHKVWKRATNNISKRKYTSHFHRKGLNIYSLSDVLKALWGEKDWYDMNFLETEALLLLFDSTEYFLPPFLKSMKKLKFLMISNCGTNKATVKGLDVLLSLTQLNSVRLERLISPLGGKQSIQALQNIEKLSLNLCEGFDNITTFTKLQDFNLDHSNDSGELLPGICNGPSTLSCSITNCHQLQNLPYDFANMISLKMLRLSALPHLEQLPASIGKLEQLEYLDISLREGLKELPKEIGQLKKLKELDMSVVIWQCYLQVFVN